MNALGVVPPAPSSFPIPSFPGSLKAAVDQLLSQSPAEETGAAVSTPAPADEAALKSAEKPGVKTSISSPLVVFPPPKLGVEVNRQPPKSELTPASAVGRGPRASGVKPVDVCLPLLSSPLSAAMNAAVGVSAPVTVVLAGSTMNGAPIPAPACTEERRRSKFSLPANGTPTSAAAGTASTVLVVAAKVPTVAAADAVGVVAALIEATVTVEAEEPVEAEEDEAEEATSDGAEPADPVEERADGVVEAEVDEVAVLRL